jgi:hypothetical protein
MISSRSISFNVPYKDLVIGDDGLLSVVWTRFFRLLHQIIDSTGIESYSDILNNQAIAKDVDGLKFNSDNLNCVIIDYLIQRITTGGGAQELLESGVLYCVFKPTSNTWVLSKPLTAWPVNAGVTFSITADGSVQYVSTNITGTESISKLTYRARSLAAKI